VNGVQGFSASVDGGAGVAGASTTLTGTGVGVFGGAKSDGTAYGVSGHIFSLTGAGAGVAGQSDSSIGVGVRGYAPAVSGANYGVQGISESSTGVGVFGLANSASGFNVGILGITNSATGTAGVFKNAADGQILSGRNSSSQVFSVSGTGAVTATSFSGSGAGLTGVTAATATDATQLGGVAAANYARVDVGNSFVSAQTFFPASSSTGVTITQTGTGTGLDVETVSSTSPALFAHSSATSGFPTGVWGQSDAPSGIGVRGTGTAATGGGIGVYGESSALSGVGVWAQPTHPTGNTAGVFATNPSSAGTGVWGRVTDSTGGSTVGVEGDTFSANGIAGKFVSGNSAGKILSGRDSSSEVFAVNGTGNISTYNGNATAGNGVASVHGSFSAAVGALTPVNTTILFTPSGATGGLYRATCYMVNTASGTGPNAIATIHWTDDSGNSQNGICSTFVTTNLGDYVSGSVVVQWGAGLITFSVTSNASAYKIYISLEKLI
jgi:hypothetical protein